nr:EOG090X02LQ [Polyphemus pediculus]
MAGSVETVNNMIDTLLEKAFSAQEKELKDLHEFAVSRGFSGELQLWDVPFWRRKQKTALFQCEEGEVREFFPLPRVMDGLLSLIEQVFGIKIERMDSDKVWHPDVSLYAVRNEAGTLIGHFYFDPYSRLGRKLLSREAASWMIGMRSRSDIVGQTPSAAVVLNFTPPLHGIPSLLSFSQVNTLFSKMGHALQHLLTQSPYSEIAGLTNLEWDAVQISAHFLQCWLSEWSTVAKISGHFESGQPMPREMFEQLNQAKTHMAGTDLCQQLYLSALDLELYSNKIEYWNNVVKRLWPKFQTFKLEKYDAHPCSFTEVISGDWSAAYYSHVWSKMVATDMFSAFQENGFENQETVKAVGARFRDVVLGSGGSCHPSETFRQFRGRDPSPLSLLNFVGLSRKV